MSTTDNDALAQAPDANQTATTPATPVHTDVVPVDAAPADAVPVDGATSPQVAAVELTDLDGGGATGSGPGIGNLELLRDIEVAVTVELGRAQLRVQDVLELHGGSVVELNRPVGAPVDLLANGRVIARGQIVVVENQLGVRVTDFGTGGAGG